MKMTQLVLAQSSSRASFDQDNELHLRSLPDEMWYLIFVQLIELHLEERETANERARSVWLSLQRLSLASKRFYGLLNDTPCSLIDCPFPYPANANLYLHALHRFISKKFWSHLISDEREAHQIIDRLKDCPTQKHIRFIFFSTLVFEQALTPYGQMSKLQHIFNYPIYPLFPLFLTLLYSGLYNDPAMRNTHLGLVLASLILTTSLYLQIIPDKKIEHDVKQAQRRFALSRYSIFSNQFEDNRNSLFTLSRDNLDQMIFDPKARKMHYWSGRA